MKNEVIGLLFICVSGCASCHQQSAAPSGIPMAGMTAAPASSVASSEATPAVGIGWETISFSIPKPKLFAVPKPQQGPQVVGIPILAGAPTMTMGQPAMMASPAMMGQPAMVAQPQYVQTPATVTQQSNPAAQSSAPACNSCPPAGCAEEGCQSQPQTQTQVMQECDALMGEIADLQRQISVRAGNKASVDMVD